MAAKGVTTRSRIHWSADKKTLYFDSQALKMQQLIDFIHELLNRVEQILSQHLLFQQNRNIPEFDLSQINNPSMHDSGYYFGLRQVNAWIKARIRMIQ